MNRQKELVKNTVILTFGKICTQFVSFLLLPLYTALLSPTEYGLVDLINTYIVLLTPVFNWQFESGLFRFLIDYRSDANKQRKLFSTIIVTNVLQSLLYLLFFILIQRYITTEYKIFLALDVVVNIILNSLLQFPRGLGKNIIYSIGSFLSAAITVALNVLFIAVFSWGAYGLFIATIISKIATAIYLIFAMKAWKFFSLREVDFHIFNKIFKYSIPLVPNQLSWWVVGASDRTIVSKYIGVATNGIYSVANKFPSVFTTFYNIFNLSWTESVSLHMNDADRDEFLTDTINTMFNLFAAIDIGIIACMPFIFNLLINKQYDDAYFQIPILMIAVIFQVVVGLYSVIYVALKKSSEIAKTSLFAAIINIVVDLALIRVIGLYAASVSTLVAYASMALYRYFDVKKYVSVSLKTKSIVITFIVASITIFSYYSMNLLLTIISLIIVVFYAILINKKFIISIVMHIKTSLTNIVAHKNR